MFGHPNLCFRVIANTIGHPGVILNDFLMRGQSSNRNRAAKLPINTQSFTGQTIFPDVKECYVSRNIDDVIATNISIQFSAHTIGL